MKPDSTSLRIDLLEAYDRLLASIQTLCASIHQDRKLPVWVSRTEEEIESGLAARAKAVQLYQALWYEDGQDGRETLTCPGIVGSSQTTLDDARVCNDAKDGFKTAVLRLKALRKPQADALLETLHQRNRDVALSMQRMGAARLNLKQAYRHIPLLDTRPSKIGFTWSKQGRTIQRTSVAEVRRLLERRHNAPQAQQELSRLAAIPSNETLARVRSVCPHLRANVVFAQDHDNAGVERRLMQAPLPILVPLSGAQRLPDFVPIPPAPTAAKRLRRSDVRIEDEVFLPLVRVYRYRENYRDANK